MNIIDVIFKLNEKEEIIKCSANDRIYELFNKNKKNFNKNQIEFKLYFEGKKIRKEILIKDILKEKYINSNKLRIIVKPIIDSINLKYKLNTVTPSVNLFGTTFIEKNKNISKIIYEGKEYNLVQKFIVPNYDFLIKNNIKEINITLTNINNITDISHMFNFSDFLFSEDISKWDTQNITDMSFLFSDCSTLESIPDISNWDTSNVINISEIFYNCNSLQSLPDISKWDTSNIKYMRNIFRNCKSLISLPDISKWNMTNCYNICSLFQGCSSLKEIPDISKWDISNIIDLSYLFNDCENLYKIPDISNWNTKNVKSFRGLFWNCIKLNSLPDISKWDTSNNLNISNMFCNCRELTSLPDLSKWDTFNVMNMGNIFNGCCSLSSLFDISKWKTGNIRFKGNMFDSCINLLFHLIVSLIIYIYLTILDKRSQFFSGKYFSYPSTGYPTATTKSRVSLSLSAPSSSKTNP